MQAVCREVQSEFEEIKHGRVAKLATANALEAFARKGLRVRVSPRLPSCVLQ